MFGYVGLLGSAGTTQLYQHRLRTASGNMEMDRHGHVPIKPDSQKQILDGFGSLTIVCQPLA